MKITKTLGTALMAVLLLFTINVHATSLPHIVVLDDATNVASAADDIQATLESQGFTIAVDLNLGAAANGNGINLPDTELFFARLPAFAEKRLLRKADTMGIDAALRFLVYEEDGQILLATNSIGHIIDKQDARSYDYLLNHMDHAIQQFGEADQGVVTISSNRPHDQALQVLLNAISNAGLTLNGVIDYTDSNLPYYYRHRRAATLVIFGNIAVGGPILQAARTAALDLPPKLLIWEDRHGDTFISYEDPQVWAKRHGISAATTPQLNGVRGAVMNLSAAAAGN